MGEPIIVEQEFDASAERLWSAITDQDQMVQWYFAEITGFKLEVGHKVEFTVSVEDRDFIHQSENVDLTIKRVSVFY